MLIDHVPDALRRIDAWVNEIASSVAAPVRSPLPDSDFVWRHPDQGPEVVLISKVIRLASAMSGAWRLAEAGQTTEAGTLLRLVDDFSSEVWFVGDAILSGKPNKAQRKFIEKFFEPMARDVDEYLARERDYCVSRGEINKTLTRMAKDTGSDHELHRDFSRFLNYGLNRYAHGAYETVMELYNGGTARFEVLGSNSGRPIESSKKFAAAKCTEACLAIGLAATALGRQDLVSEIRAFLDGVDPSLK